MSKEDAALGAEAQVIRGASGREYVPLPTAQEEEAFRQMQKKQPPTDSILDEAKRIIYGDREKTYGRPDRNLHLIAGYWNEHLNARFGEEGLPAVHITMEDVCIMMVLLKTARLANDPKHRDSMIDGCGYLALMERIQK